MEVRKLSDVFGVPIGEIIDFIIKGFLLMLRLKNIGLANKQLYGPYILNEFLINYINLSPAMA